MSIKQYQVNKAYQALRRVSDFSIPLKKAYEIYALIKCLEAPFNFQAEREKKLIEKYGCTVQPDGMVVFKKKEDAGNFQIEISELNDMDVDVEYTPVIIDEKDMTGCSISPNDLFALEGFVEIKR